MQLELEWRDLVGGVTILFVALNYLHQRYAVIAGITERVRGIETQFNLVWDLLKGKVGFIVKAPTHYRMDTLIDALVHQQEQFTLVDGYELRLLLQVREREHDLEPGRRVALALMQGYVETWLYRREREETRAAMGSWTIRRVAMKLMGREREETCATIVMAREEAARRAASVSADGMGAA
jgi:hypothetical protein